MSFVESYRKLTRVPEPVKKEFRVEELFDRIKLLYSSLENSGNVILDIESREKHDFSVADQNLISQVLINLLKNAVEANENNADARILLSASIKNGAATEICVTDNGSEFNAKKTEEPCIELGCWAHARRKFFDLHKANQSPVAKEALVRIGQLYAIEEEGKDLSCAARKQLRAEKSQPVLNDLHDWLTKVRARTANGGASAKAMDYTLRRWAGFIRYANSGASADR